MWGTKITCTPEQIPNSWLFPFFFEQILMSTKLWICLMEAKQHDVVAIKSHWRYFWYSSIGSICCAPSFMQKLKTKLHQPPTSANSEHPTKTTHPQRTARPTTQYRPFSHFQFSLLLFADFRKNFNYRATINYWKRNVVTFYELHAVVTVRRHDGYSIATNIYITK